MPSRSARAIANNLPVDLTSFFGRAAELGRAAEHVEAMAFHLLYRVALTCGAVTEAETQLREALSRSTVRTP